MLPGKKNLFWAKFCRTVKFYCYMTNLVSNGNFTIGRRWFWKNICTNYLVYFSWSRCFVNGRYRSKQTKAQRLLSVCKSTINAISIVLRHHSFRRLALLKTKPSLSCFFGVNVATPSEIYSCCARAIPVVIYFWKTNENILQAVQNFILRMITKSARYIHNDNIMIRPRFGL